MKLLLDTPCIPWPGRIRATDPDDGYGRLTVNGVQNRAHIALWRATFGEVPDGLVLDHVCCNRACVNPFHLEPVTVRENTLRGNGLTAENARKTHCIRGHEFSGDNLLITYRGVRACRKCQHQHMLKNRAKKRAERKTQP